MSQIAIREYDSKRMFADFAAVAYAGILVENLNDLAKIPAEGRFVVKPDQLFGKRGKLGLVWVNLNTEETTAWIKERYGKTVEINGVTGKLHTFLVEPFVPHAKEYYIAIKTERDYDELLWSDTGGMDVEENWESVKSLRIWVLENLTEEMLMERLQITDGLLNATVRSLFVFARKCGFAYLEVNPLVLENNQVYLLDMVAKLDSTEEFRQKEAWKNVKMVNPFGRERTDAEDYIADLDSKTGASLKLSILNPKWNIWMLLSWGWASVILSDTLAKKGFAGQIANYGECSGNPDRENTREYTKTLLKEMLKSNTDAERQISQKWGHFCEDWVPKRTVWGNTESEERKIWTKSDHFSEVCPKKYLLIAGAIANFTHIDKTFAGVLDAIEEYKDVLKAQNVTILVRRGGINDTKGLAMFKTRCESFGIIPTVHDGNMYMTDILEEIRF